jgi:hypothetical protein
MDKIIGAMTTANADYGYKCGLFFMDDRLVAVQMGSSDENRIDDNYETWARVVESVNANKTSLVDYRITALPDWATANTIKTTSYEDITSVTITKATDTGNDPSYDQYEINFIKIIKDIIKIPIATGYRIPAATLDEAVELLNKTPLASKLKLPTLGNATKTP